MEHSQRVSINASPHTEACFDLRLMLGAHIYNISTTYLQQNPAMTKIRIQIFAAGSPLLYHYRSIHAVTYVTAQSRG